MADNLLILEQSLGSLALTAIIYGILLRWKTNKLALDLTLGLVFGCGAVLEILDPLKIAPGVILDLRNLFVGFSGAYLGPLGAAVTMVIAGAARAMVGGAGTQAGLAAIVLATLMGAAWGHFLRDRDLPPIASHLLLGAMISTSLASSVLLPSAAFWQLWTFGGPAVVAITLFAAVTFGAFIERERLLAHKERRLTAEANLDPLTSLLNRRSFNASYKAASAQPPGSGIGVLAFDIDHFKRINDRHGHASGDVALQVVADALRATLRDGDLLARFGGEEFVAVLPDVTRDALGAIAERARRAVAQVDQLPGHTKVTISIGALWAPCWLDMDSAMHAVDAALYRAKQDGRDRVVFGSQVRTAA